MIRVSIIVSQTPNPARCKPGAYQSTLWRPPKSIVSDFPNDEVIEGVTCSFIALCRSIRSLISHHHLQCCALLSVCRLYYYVPHVTDDMRLPLELGSWHSVPVPRGHYVQSHTWKGTKLDLLVVVICCQFYARCAPRDSWHAVLTLATVKRVALSLINLSLGAG